jgi:hypothetical protein
VLKVDGKEVAKQKIPHTIPFLMTVGETFDVGSDTRTLPGAICVYGESRKGSVQLN